ncbi:hypothetical protein ACI798_21445 [Geodermatophilus sp. SYSU D01045]
MGWVVLTVVGLVLELALVVALGRAVTSRDEEVAAVEAARPADGARRPPA